MAKVQKWEVVNDGVPYEISYTGSAWTGKSVLIVNGEQIDVRKKGLQAMAGVDIPVMLGNKEIRFVKVGSKADLAVDGVYLNSGKDYTPLGKVPWWAWIFAVLCIAIPIVSLGGALPVLLGVGGALISIQTSIRPDLKTGVKVLVGLVCVIVAWGLFYALLLAAAMA